MRIVYENDRFVVAEKPVGLDSEHDMPRALAQQLGGAFYPVHRLDQNVGGLMVYGRDEKTAASLSAQIQQGTFEKEYVACVHGAVPESGVWTDYLYKDSRKNKVFVVKKKRAGVKEARLSFARLQEGERSVVRIKLYTGRSHQIRVQFSSRGYPLVGDHKYGSRAEEKAPMLYCCYLKFRLDREYTFEDLPYWAE